MVFELCNRFKLRIKALVYRRKLDRDLADELKFHLEMREAELKAGGVRSDEARYTARRLLGNLSLTKESSRELWTFVFIESCWQDLHFAARILCKNPGFSVVAVLTLALGIGANTAIFSLVNALMFRVLPVQNPQELVEVETETRNVAGGLRQYYTNPIWEAFRDQQDVFNGVFAWGESRFNLATGGVADNINGLYASGGYFATLGIRPFAGRLFSEADDRHGCPGVAVLSYSFWNAQYHRDAIANSNIEIEGHPFQIIGVSESWLPRN